MPCTYTCRLCLTNGVARRGHIGRPCPQLRTIGTFMCHKNEKNTKSMAITYYIVSFSHKFSCSHVLARLRFIHNYKNTFCGTRYLSHCHTLLITSCSVSKISMLPGRIYKRTHYNATRKFSKADKPAR